jgi:hypothetical protein
MEPMPRMEGYATHSPILAAVVTHVAATAAHMSGLAEHREVIHKPKVAELGMGWYSTPMLTAMATTGWINLTSFEGSALWMAHIEPGVIHSDNHRVERVGDNDWGRIDTRPFDVVFVDHSPNNTREAAIRKLIADRGKVGEFDDPFKFAVIHDTDQTNSPNLGPAIKAMYEGFHNVWQFEGCGKPHVCVCSFGGTMLPPAFDSCRVK